MYWTAQIYKVLHSWFSNCLIVIHYKKHILYCTAAQTRVLNTHTALAGAPLPLPPSPKFHQMKFGLTTGSAQWYVLVYSVLSHFKGAGMTSSVDSVTHEMIVSLRVKEHCLALSIPYL